MGLQETPIVIDGVIYSISSGDKVAALDGKTGQTLWGGSTGPPPFPRAHDAEYRDHGVRNACAWLDGRTTSRR
jgi:hypothetical protein